MDLSKAIKSVNTSNIDWDEYKVKGNEMFKAGQYNAAIECYSKAIDAMPEHAVLYSNRAMARLKVQQFEDAERDCSICIKLDSNQIKAWFRRGLARKALNKYRLALADFKVVCELEPNNEAAKKQKNAMKKKLAQMYQASLQKMFAPKKEKFIVRIVKLFKRFQNDAISDEGLNDYVYKQYEGNISNFLDDYHRFIANMYSNRSNIICSKKNCVFLKRRRRLKRSENGYKQSIIGQRLEQIHILCHQYDEEQKMKNDKNYKRQIVKDKKAECDDMDEKEPQSNKFVTDIKAPSASLMNGKYLKYSQGFKFYYHSFYKDNDTYQLGKGCNYEMMPNFYKSTTNKRVAFKFWYVLPKYKDLKEEIVYGGHLTLDQFQNEIAKAEVNICAVEAKTLRANGEFEERYNVQTGSAITVNHMLCIMLYTNYDDLQNKLSKTFRRLTETESDEQLKERHKSFVNISRLMTETIWCFGSNKLKGPVYHGVNTLTIFENFSVQFCGPTSTTTSESIAINFATNGGTVITIQGAKGNKQSNHFDCELWSDYPWEKEKLFIGMRDDMLIVNVHDIRTDFEYKEWIDVIEAFSHLLIDGLYLMSPILHFVEKNVHLLIDSVTNNTVNCIPEYIVDTFNNIRVNTWNIGIDLNLLSKDIWWKHKDSVFVYYGGKKFKNVYFDKNGNIKWAFINSLFPNLGRVRIGSMVPYEEDTNIYSWSNSILLTDDMLNDILVFLKVSNIERIDIFAPQNNEYSLKQQIAKFSAKYKEIGYHLYIYQRGNREMFLNQCIVFGIESVTGK